jgi:hypothetical protein
MVVVDALHLHGDSAAAVADDLFGGGADLHGFFDHMVLGHLFLRGFLRFLVGK